METFEVDHATLYRWVVKYSPLIAIKAQAAKRSTRRSWHMDEAYDLYRAADKHGQTLDFTLSERRDTTVATKFYAQA